MHRMNATKLMLMRRCSAGRFVPATSPFRDSTLRNTIKQPRSQSRTQFVAGASDCVRLGKDSRHLLVVTESSRETSSFSRRLHAVHANVIVTAGAHVR